MARKFLIPLLTAVFLATPAFAPAIMTSLSGSADAETKIKSTKSNASERSTTINSTKSNTFRTKHSGNKFRSTSDFRATWIPPGGKAIKRKKLRRIETR